MGGLGKYVTCHISEFLFFLFSAFFSAPRSHFLTDRHDYTPKRVFPAKDVPFGGLDNIRLHLGGQSPKKPPQNGGNRHISGTVEARNFKFGMHIDHEGH